MKGAPARGGLTADETRRCILLICVSYHSDDLAVRLVESFLRLRSAGCLHIVVVDNSVNDPELRFAGRIEHPQVTVLAPPANMGYFGAASYALSHYLYRHSLPDWVIVANVDLTVTDAAFLERLIGYPQASDLAVIAPSIRSRLTGHEQNPFLLRRPSRWRMMFYKYLFRVYWLLILYRLLGVAWKRLKGLPRMESHSGRDLGTPRTKVVYAAHGSFMIFSREYFVRGGNLNYPSFLFGEEMFVAESARRLGLQILHDPGFQVVHEDHAGTGVVMPRHLARELARSAAYCADSYFPS